MTMAVKKEEKLSLITHFHQKSPEAEAFKVLRTNLQFIMVDKEIKTILATSVGPDEGKSTVLANLAVTLAQAGKEVLLVDCDLRLPVQHKIFKISNEKGLTNALAEAFPLEDCIVYETGVPKVSVLPSGPIPPNPSELLGSNKMTNLLEELSQNYDFVLVDAPPVLAVTDAVLLSTKVDGVLLVTLSGHTPVDRAREAKEQLKRANARILGAVLNGVERSKKDHYYYYYYSENR